MAYYAAGTLIPSKLHLIQTASKQSDCFRFLQLPGEIRNKIYDLVFESCLVEVRMKQGQQFCQETIDQPFMRFQCHSDKQYDKKLHLEGRKPAEKLAHHRTDKGHPKADLEPAKQAPVLLQEHSGTIPQKCTKPQQRGRRNCKKSPSRMHHRVLTSVCSEKGRPPAQYRVPFSFLFSCPQIYDEAVCVMYAQTAFRFTSTAAIRKFLSVTSLRALQAIQKLEIFHATHGEPALTANRKFKVNADRKWSETCKQIRERMTGVRELRLSLHLNEWPSQLSLREEWAQPILSLRGHGLDRVDATLFHSAFSQDRLKEAACDLETAMMSEEGRLAKLAESKKLNGAKKTTTTTELKARKVLVIKMDNIPAISGARKA